MKLKTSVCHFPAALLVGYLTYSTFVPVNSAHSIILTALAALFGFSMYTQFHLAPKYTDQMQKLAADFDQKLQEQKEQNDKRCKALEDEFSRSAISKVNAGAPSSPVPKKNAPIF